MHLLVHTLIALPKRASPRICGELYPGRILRIFIYLRGVTGPYLAA